jgi:hypothetical protein
MYIVLESCVNVKTINYLKLFTKHLKFGDYSRK